LLAFLAGGAFIGVAFSPIGYLFAGFFMCLLQARQHVQLNAEVISNSPESDALITAQAVTE